MWCKGGGITRRRVAKNMRKSFDFQLKFTVDEWPREWISLCAAYVNLISLHREHSFYDRNSFKLFRRGI